MPSVLDHVRPLALELSADDREQLIHELLVSLEPADYDDGVDAAWVTEINRRRDEIREGKAKLVDMDEALDRILAAAIKGES